jgi:hypothetical protein
MGRLCAETPTQRKDNPYRAGIDHVVFSEQELPRPACCTPQKRQLQEYVPGSERTAGRDDHAFRSSGRK